jgi:hypothetical protein
VPDDVAAHTDLLGFAQWELTCTPAHATALPRLLAAGGEIDDRDGTWLMSAARGARGHVARVIRRTRADRESSQVHLSARGVTDVLSEYWVRPTIPLHELVR